MAFKPDSSYESPLDFAKTVKFISEIAATDNYPLEKDILVIAVEDAVFIRTTNIHWCRFFDSLCEIENEAVRFYSLKDGDFDEFTANYEQADESYGDQQLATWKIAG